MEKKPYFYEDEAGKWWYFIPATGKRMSAELRTCTGCGTSYPARTVLVKGKPSMYCTRTCSNKHTTRTGATHHRWTGGRLITNEGYVRVYKGRRTYDLEHRVVMEGHLGRPLRANETVHHKNADRQDNRLENLELRVGAHGQGASAPHCSTCRCFET